MSKNNKNFILVTGCAGFIGFHTVQSLLNKNLLVFGLDNLNNYYNQKLKLDRLKILKKSKNFKFLKLDLRNRNKLFTIFNKFKFKKVINLAAQAGVRYSLKNPSAYIDTNIVGFGNLLEACRIYKCKHLVFASSSSVYGANNKIPFREKDNTDKPIQLYAATKKSNEVMAYAYSELYNFRTTGLRFFTVYGPWGRPDMAIFSFTKNIFQNKKVNIYNNGNHLRDFTYVTDIVDAILLCISKKKKKNEKYEIFNVGNSKPINILKFLKIIEKNIGIKAKVNFKPKQPGDMISTYSQISKIKKKFNYQARMKLEKGIANFLDWYREYYKVKK